MKLNKYSTLALLAASSISLSACIPAIIGGAAAGTTYVAKDERTVGTIVDDASITAQIKAKYVKDSLVSAVDIHVDTSKGIVTLSGNAPSYEAKKRAISIAKNTQHTTRIIDKITVIR